MRNGLHGICMTGFVMFGMLASPVHAQRQSVPRTSAGEALVTSRKIAESNPLGATVGNMPMSLAITPDGKFAITADMGYRQALWMIDTKTGQAISHLNFINRSSANKASPLPPGETAAPTPDAAPEKTNGLYYGLIVSTNNTVYAAQGGNQSVVILSMDNRGTLKERERLPTRAHDFPAGIAIDDNNHLFVANNASGEGNPFNYPGSIAIYDLTSKEELGRYTFSSSHGGTSNFPLAIAALRDGGAAYVAAERDDSVYVIRTTDPAKPELTATLKTGSRPAALLLSRDQKQFFVANSLSDTVSIVDTAENRITGTILLRPAVVRDLAGATPTSMTLSPDEKTLYVTLGDMNAVAIVDLTKQEVQGYFATGWYPSAIAVIGDGTKAIVANAKGNSVRNPNNKIDPHDPKRKHGYILSILDGSANLIDIPTGDALQRATQEVLKNNRLDALDRTTANPLREIGLAAGKIKHVIYIIKENRTYDEVLGDLKQGNGDSSLVLFGREITPNQHALAERFVLLDNLYACGEVSGDGWVWSTQGMANAYVIRNVPYNYSGRGRAFDFEGANNDYPTGGLPERNDVGKPFGGVFKNGAAAIPDVANTGRNLWDAAKDAHISLRNYGFFLYSGDSRSGVDNYPNVAGLQPPGHDLEGVTDLDFRRFDMEYADSDAPVTYFKKSGDAACLFATRAFGKHESPSRFAEWYREFQMMLAKDTSGDAVPALMLVRFPTDHTMGARSGKHTPKSYIADNDYAVGQLVEAVSHSPIWKSTAIFIIEDDAQNGADHIDGHRTTGYVISPWIKSHSVDHRFYNTDSMLKTMELLLGLEPLCQYDAIADPILDWDTTPSNVEPFDAIMPPQSLIAETNPQAHDLGMLDLRRTLAVASDQMNFSHADAAPALELNKVIWKTVKGVKSEMPAARGQAADDDD